jgi:hypothetical protein
VSASGERTQDIKPYTVAEVSELTGFSRQTVTRMFEREPGVLIIGNAKSVHDKRSYRSIRIPRAVYERVVWALTVKAERHSR